MKDDGSAVAVSPLPQVLVRAGQHRKESKGLFRGRVDRMFSLRGFSVEYAWKKKPEVTLETQKPFAQAVSMISGFGGLEVKRAAFVNGVWRFEGGRPKPRNMYEDKFEELEKFAKPVAAARDEQETAG